MITVDVMKVAVVQEVAMTIVLDGPVTTAWLVLVVVLLVNPMPTRAPTRAPTHAILLLRTLHKAAGGAIKRPRAKPIPWRALSWQHSSREVRKRADENARLDSIPGHELGEPVRAQLLGACRAFACGKSSTGLRRDCLRSRGAQPLPDVIVRDAFGIDAPQP
jgi:hypothetical protein